MGLHLQSSKFELWTIAANLSAVLIRDSESKINRGRYMAFNLSTQEGEAGRSLGSRIVNIIVSHQPMRQTTNKQKTKLAR